MLFVRESQEMVFDAHNRVRERFFTPRLRVPSGACPRAREADPGEELNAWLLDPCTVSYWYTVAHRRVPSGIGVGAPNLTLGCRCSSRRSRHGAPVVDTNDSAARGRGCAWILH
jgi:hypothetical protein